MVKTTPDDLNTDYMALCRETTDDNEGRTTVHRMLGNSKVGIEFIVVPRGEVAARVEQGWEVWYAPMLAFMRSPGYQDPRNVERPRDVHNRNDPFESTNMYLQQGNNFLASRLSKGTWVTGQLPGQNGSDTDAMQQSPTYLPVSKARDEMTERRSATSIGHVLQKRRPPGVCVGWGGYDDWTNWQSFGRPIPKEQVGNKDWSKDLLAPARFEDDKGEIVETVKPALELADLPNLGRLETLYENMNKDKPNRKQHGTEPAETWTTLHGCD